MDARLATRTNVAVPTPTLDEPSIQGWLVTRVASLVNQPQCDIDITVPFSYYALDSVAAVGLSGELGEWLGLKLSPTLIWDYPSIELVARYLAAQDRV